MDYISRYGLEYNPFIKNTRNTTVETSEYHEITFRLNLLLQTRGFGLLTGSPGRGKTTMVRNWSESLNDAAYKIIYVSLSTITVQDFYIQLVASLGQEPCYKKSKNFRLIQSGIERLNVEKKMTPVIVLDEANYLSNSVLNDLKIIFNFDMDSRDKAVVLLVGPYDSRAAEAAHNDELQHRCPKQGGGSKVRQREDEHGRMPSGGLREKRS